MVPIEMAYAVFALAAGLVFRFLSVRVAILTVFLGGWLVLPVGIYPVSAAEVHFPWWITGVAVPSDMLLTKGWVPGLTALVWAVVTDPVRLRGFRPAAFDLPMLAWCLWPLLAGWFVVNPDPAPAIASAYLLGTWGVPWLLGRIWFNDPQGRVALLKGMAVSGLVCLPFALAEGVAPAWLYGLLYEPHPFRFDGVSRPVGYRPIGLFEHGNQYALWVSLGAVAAVWLAAARLPDSQRWPWVLVAPAVVAITLASQSRSAIVLGAGALFLMAVWRWRLASMLLIGTVIMATALLTLHVSGVLPLQQLVRDTELGRQALGFVRGVGMGSFSWRIGQDVRTLSMILEAPLFGTGRWDWSHPEGTRPWGLWLLLSGQYGLGGAGLALATLTALPLAVVRAARRHPIWSETASAVPLAMIALLAMADAWLNSWLFFPALLAAGAIARPAAAALPAGPAQA